MLVQHRMVGMYMFEEGIGKKKEAGREDNNKQLDLLIYSPGSTTITGPPPALPVFYNYLSNTGLARYEIESNTPTWAHYERTNSTQRLVLDEY